MTPQISARAHNRIQGSKIPHKDLSTATIYQALKGGLHKILSSLPKCPVSVLLKRSSTKPFSESPVSLMPQVGFFGLSPSAPFWIMLGKSTKDSFLHQPQWAGFEMVTALSLSQGVPGFTRVKFSW